MVGWTAEGYFHVELQQLRAVLSAHLELNAQWEFQKGDTAGHAVYTYMTLVFIFPVIFHRCLGRRPLLRDFDPIYAMLVHTLTAALSDRPRLPSKLSQAVSLLRIQYALGRSLLPESSLLLESSCLTGDVCITTVSSSWYPTGTLQALCDHRSLSSDILPDRNVYIYLFLQG